MKRINFSLVVLLQLELQRLCSLETRDLVLSFHPRIARWLRIASRAMKTLLVLLTSCNYLKNFHPKNATLEKSLRNIWAFKLCPPSFHFFYLIKKIIVVAAILLRTWALHLGTSCVVAASHASWSPGDRAWDHACVMWLSKRAPLCLIRQLRRGGGKASASNFESQWGGTALEEEVEDF